MSGNVIGDVGDTLVQLLRDGITGLQNDQIVLLSPADAEGNNRIRLTLFLYSVVEYPEMKNESPLVASATESRPAPLSLELYYLLTAYPGNANDPHTNTVEAHHVLGRAMQIFYDNGILTGSVLRGSLLHDEELRVTLNPITVEDLTRIWSVFPNTVFHPSASYLVTPARIDSERSLVTRRVTQKRAELDHIVAKR